MLQLAERYYIVFVRGLERIYMLCIFAPVVYYFTIGDNIVYNYANTPMWIGQTLMYNTH